MSSPKVLAEEEAYEVVLSAVTAGEGVRLPLAGALGSFLREPLLAEVSSPPFDCSAMDGYVVAPEGEDYTKGTTFLIEKGEICPGEDPGTLEGGRAKRVFTGAPVPANTGCVVMQEDVTIENGSIALQEDYEPGEFVRRKGADLCAGQRIAEDGCPVTPQMLAAAASQEKSNLLVGPKPRVSVLTTGNELVTAGAPLRKGEIYNSNAPLLSGLLSTCGASVVAHRHARDRKETLRFVAESLPPDSEFVISTGGVSVGEHDHIPWLVEQLGYEVLVHGVAMRPGKPFLFARHPAGRYFFGLPGNPASSLVCFHRFVGPALRRRMGAAEVYLPGATVEVRLATEVSGDASRPHYLRGKRIGEEFYPRGIQESHAIAGMAQSDALLRVEAGAALSAGERVKISLLG